MHRNNLGNDEFISRIREIILENISTEHFGVEGLSKKTGLPSREINQRLLEIKGKHVNQFIREIRLQKSLDLLADRNINASEVAYKVGFSSPSYFSKCFHDQFGYPPGKLKKEDLPVHEPEKGIMASWWQKLMPKKIFLILLTNGSSIIFLGISTYFQHDKDNFVQSDGKITLEVMPVQDMKYHTFFCKRISF